MVYIRGSKPQSSQERRDTMQAVTEKQREEFYKIYGFVPKNEDNTKKGYRGSEKDEWERKRKGIANHKHI